ncbi:hypothetical protein, partial [Deinococcus ruber]|uniref:hypothetical protein n=1 Tax=Deinococcus ruber TaxID=1848197 RepID=UPI001E5BD7BA
VFCSFQTSFAKLQKCSWQLLGLDRMVNVSELLLNVVTPNKLKLLNGLTQNKGNVVRTEDYVIP